MAAAPPTEDAEDWVKLAMKDDVAVVSVLLDIRHAEPPPPPSKFTRHGSPVLKLEWSVRQRRSKHVPRHNSSDVVDGKKKKAELTTRASPTTPLSWSGATSVSGGAIDGSEESSKPPKPTDAARSKVAVRSCTTISKRPRKRKTLAQLKEEESLLLKERRNLKKELLTLRQNVEKQRATNESLKRIKLQQTMMKVASSASGEAIWYQTEQVNAVSELTRIIDLGNSQSSHPSNLSYVVQEVGNCREAAFPLPDLNLPFEDDRNSEAICGMS